MTIDDVVRELVKTADLFGLALSETRIEAYLEALDDLPHDKVAVALASLRSTARFFPRPIEVRETVEGTLGDEAERIWCAVREASTPRELSASDWDYASDAISSVGGWPMLHGEANIRQVAALHRDFVAIVARRLHEVRRYALQDRVETKMLAAAQKQKELTP